MRVKLSLIVGGHTTQICTPHRNPGITRETFFKKIFTTRSQKPFFDPHWRPETAWSDCLIHHHGIRLRKTVLTPTRIDMNISIECVIKPSTLSNCTKMSNRRLEEFTCAIIFTLQISSKIIRWCILAQTNSAWLVNVVIWVAITSDSLNFPLFTVFLCYRGWPSITTAVHPKISRNCSQTILDWPISLTWHAVGLALPTETDTAEHVCIGSVPVRLPGQIDWSDEAELALVLINTANVYYRKAAFRPF